MSRYDPLACRHCGGQSPDPRYCLVTWGADHPCEPGADRDPLETTADELATIAADAWSDAKRRGMVDAARLALAHYREARRMPGAHRRATERPAGCVRCGRPVHPDTRRPPACGCDWTFSCELHTADRAAPLWCRPCARSTMRRALERATR